MPIYEYECRACHHQFEAIVRLPEKPVCPSCESEDLERLVSLFAVDSGESRRIARDAARRQHAKTTKEKAHAEYEYDRKHHEHG